MAADDGFLSRWSRRKAERRGGEPAEAAPLPVREKSAPRAPSHNDAEPALPMAGPRELLSPSPSAAAPATPAVPAPPLPTLDDVARLTHASDFSPYVARNVDASVRNAAMKKLFSDPRFNVMDGLDTYIDDYGKPDPIPPSMLRRMNQSAVLGLFADEPADEAPSASLAVASTTVAAEGPLAVDAPVETPSPTLPAAVPPSATDDRLPRADDDPDL